jgi:membrane-associated PAP2 superfamily phosphatase
MLFGIHNSGHRLYLKQKKVFQHSKVLYSFYVWLSLVGSLGLFSKTFSTKLLKKSVAKYFYRKPGDVKEPEYLIT